MHSPTASATPSQSNLLFILFKIIALVIVLPGILLPLLFIILFPFNWIL